MEKVSLIIPVFNSDKYLEECLNSIISQNYCNYEVILINDGSTDESKKICENYVKSDSRVRLINQKNQGVSIARNVGIKEATGDVIMFIDSDDILEDNALTFILDNFKQNDMLCFGYTAMFKNCKNVVINDSIIKDKKEIENKILLNDKIGGYLWNKCFKASIIKKNNILFDINLHYCEDLIFVIDYLKYCNNITYINKSLYFYRMRKSSVSYNFFNMKNITLLNSYKILINRITDEKINNRLKYNYLVNYYKLKKLIPKNFDIDQCIIKDEKNIIKNEKLNIKKLLMFYLIKYFNFIYRILRNIKNKKLQLFD